MKKKTTRKITHGATNKQQTNNKQITTNNNDNNNKNDKNKRNNNSSSSNNNYIYNNNIAKIDKLMIECLNTTNTNNIMECIEYLDKLPIELIEYVLKKTARIEHPSWKYAMSILDDYVRKGFNTIEQVKGNELSFKISKQPKEETDEERIKRLNREMEERLKNDIE